MCCPRACPQEVKYQKHLHLDTFFCHCSTWRSYKCPVCVSSTGMVIDALFNHLSATGGMWNSTIKVCRRIYSQKCFGNWVQIQQPAGMIKYFLAAKGYSEDKKARQQHRTQKPNPYRRGKHMVRTTVTCNIKAALGLMPSLKFLGYHRCSEPQVMKQAISMRTTER